MRKPISIGLFVLVVFVHPSVRAEWTDITSQVSINKSVQTFDRTNRVIYSLITAHNTSGNTIYGPIRLKVFGTSIPLSQSSSTVTNETYIDIPGTILSNESKTVRIDFQPLKTKLEYSVTLERYVFPETAEYSLLFGGPGEDIIRSIEVDSDSNIIIAGSTTSLNIGSISHYFTNHPNDSGISTITYSDAFVAKLTQDGDILWVTYIGGDREDSIADITIDDAGNIYATGATFSSNFPTTDNAFQRVPNSPRAAFVSVLNSSGDQLIYSTLISGYNWNYGFVVDVDKLGDIYVAGFTHGGFPTTADSAQPNFGGSGDGFLAKIRPNQFSTDLLFSTYLGGRSWESIDAFTMDDSGDIYIATHTHSTDFPTTPGVYDETCTHCRTTDQKFDGAVVKLSADGTRLLYSTIIGGDGYSGGFRITGITVNEDHSVFVVGATGQTDLMTTDDAFQRTYGGGQNDIYLAHLDSEAKTLLFATYFGGNGNDYISFYDSLRKDNSGRLYFSGLTSSNNFPLINPLQNTIKGGHDAFAVVYNPIAKQVELSTYLGGSNAEDDPYEVDIGVNINTEGLFYLVGSTGSTDFPLWHNGVYSTYHGGGSDGFITKIDINQTHCMGSTCILNAVPISAQ